MINQNLQEIVPIRHNSQVSFVYIQIYNIIKEAFFVSWLHFCVGYMALEWHDSK